MNIDIVIPVRNNLSLTQGICDQLREQPGWRYCLIFDNGSTDGTQEYLRALTYANDRFFPYWEPDLNIYQMWSKGFEYSAQDGSDAVAILNNDIVMADYLIQDLTVPFQARSDVWITYPDYNRRVADGRYYQGLKYTQGTYRHGGMSGFCFMVRTQAISWTPLIDPAYQLWYGDDDLAFTVQKAGGKQARVLGLPVDHIGQATCNQHPEVFTDIPADRAYFERKWGKGK